MNGARRHEPPAEELTPLHVAAARGCHRCLQLLRGKRGDPQLPDQDGKRAIALAPERGTRTWVQILQDSRHARGWPPVEEPEGDGHSLSLLTEDGTDGSGSGPLSSTRRSLLEELELGGGCGLGAPLLCQGCLPALSIPWPHADPRGAALPPHPLASSTLLSAGDELMEGPQSCIGARGPPGAVPKPSSRDNPSPSAQQECGPSRCLTFPQTLGCGRVLGGCGVSSGASHLHSGPSSCSVPGDILGAVDQVPRGPPVGWAGLGIMSPAASNLGMPVLEVGTRGWDSSSSGDSSGATELFVSALETLEPSKAGGCPGALHCCVPQPRAAGQLEPGKVPCLTGAVTWDLPPTSPPNTQRVQGEDFGGGSRPAPCCEDGSDTGDVGELLIPLQGCSLSGSLPCIPGPLCSPDSLTTGDVTPQGQELPRHLHVTPRTKSRLRACAARFGASSSSLFDETLEMPRRPPRVRAPQGVPRDPAASSGHCVTLQGEDMSCRDGEGTGPLDDTEILPRAPSQPSSLPGASSSPGASPTVLLLPGDHRHPQDSPSDAQGSPGSSPTVLLLPGDHGQPQDSPSEAQGSPGASPTVLLLPGDHRQPQDSLSDARGSPFAAGSPSPRVPEGGLGQQEPLSLGTHQPHGSFSQVLAPWPPSTTVAETGSSVVPLSPAGCSAHHMGEHLEDKEQGQSPPEQHSPGTEATTSPTDATIQDRRGCPVPPRPLSDASLRRRLRALGDNPGPITELTRRLYLRRLERLAREPWGGPAGHSHELVAALRTGHVPDCIQDELELIQQFDRPDRSRHWREGLVKSSFNYLLLDPRTTQNLPLRSHRLSPAECFRTFVEGIFYVGKGTRARPYCHLTEALSQHRAGTQRGCPKVQRILEIWASGQGVVSVHCFQSSVPAEAYTRESCLVEALGLQTITNQRLGKCYGAVASWPAERRRRLGVHMLHRAMSIFLAEGERQLRPLDIQGGC